MCDSWVIGLAPTVALVVSLAGAVVAVDIGTTEPKDEVASRVLLRALKEPLDG